MRSDQSCCFMHGLGAHSGWFIDMGNSLNEQGLTVYAIDHRGFGRSGGFRGHMAQAQTPVRDAARPCWMKFAADIPTRV